MPNAIEKRGNQLESIVSRFKQATASYNKLKPYYDQTLEVAKVAHQKLSADAEFQGYGKYAGKPAVEYGVFSNELALSRPVRPDLYLIDPAAFEAGLHILGRLLSSRNTKWSSEERAIANQVVYTCVMSVAACFDLWKRASRKSPGTFFEVLMAAFVSRMLPGSNLTKHIPLAALLADEEVALATTAEELADDPDEEEDSASSVSTDLVIGKKGTNGGIVIPLKITTRERIVQPFAHQRILDSAFGQNVYRSMIACISETQLDDKTRSVKQVCVPGTIKLFQKYLAPIQAIYYCDVPQRYAAKDVQKVIAVKSMGDLFPDLIAEVGY